VTYQYTDHPCDTHVLQECVKGVTITFNKKLLLLQVTNHQLSGSMMTPQVHLKRLVSQPPHLVGYHACSIVLNTCNKFVILLILCDGNLI